ncbi:unnamed protein product [Diabrotica balteata]|uniref:DUF4371 domain-containing protein n=1 Tax=Diabrotica balteata TaxID=107213 RepID=A0A9N9XE36_DIABA|nr:unnamed protein product [Diabrotica balteata]
MKLNLIFIFVVICICGVQSNHPAQPFELTDENAAALVKALRDLLEANKNPEHLLKIVVEKAQTIKDVITVTTKTRSRLPDLQTLLKTFYYGLGSVVKLLLPPNKDVFDGNPLRLATACLAPTRQDSIPTSTSFQDDPIATVSDVLEAGSSSRRDDSSTANSDPLCDIELHPEKSSPECQILVESGVNRVDLQDPKFWPRNCVDEVLKEFKTQDLNSLDLVYSKRKIGNKTGTALNHYFIRYCSDTGTPVETFIQFLDNTGYIAEDTEASIVKILSNLNINIDDSRGQSYDNAKNMSGVDSGLQARIKSKNSLAKYVPCAAHSLNLIVQHAAECTMESTSFF